MAEPRKAAAPGTAPLLISVLLLLLSIPALTLGGMLPLWVRMTGAFLFLALAFVAAIWSYRLYGTHRSGPDRAIPLAGIVLGVFVVFLAGSFIVPASML